MIRIYFIFIFFTFCINNAITQDNRLSSTGQTFSEYQPDIAFNNLTEKDGLSYNTITGMLEDSDGYLWISTHFGLNRFDGKHFEVFFHEKNNPNSIIQNFITAICEDPSGRIWGSSWDGIFCYDKSTSIFKNFIPVDDFSSTGFQTIIADSTGTIWVGGHTGLIKFDPLTEKFKSYKYEEDNKLSISNTRLSKNSICNDPNGKGLWVATDKGINLFDPLSGTFKNHRNEENGLIFNDHLISALHVSADGIIWFFDNHSKEIIGFRNPEDGPIYRIPLGEVMNKPFAGVIFETSYNELWYSSGNYETVRIEYLNQNKIQLIKNDLRDPISIVGDFVGAAWEDRDRTVWLGTNAGISRYNKNKIFYRTIKLPYQFPELDLNWQITCIRENPNNNDWWVGSRNGKIYIVTPSSGTAQMLDLKEAFHAREVFISDILFAGDLVVISTVGNHPIQYDLKTKKFKKFHGLLDKYHDFVSRVIVQETDTTYLLSDNRYTLLRWNNKRNSIQEIAFEMPKTKEGHYHYVGWLSSYKGKGSWFIASDYTIAYLYPGDSIIYTIPLPVGVAVNQGGFFQSLITDRDGNAWFTFTTQGLYQVKKRIEKVRSYEDIELLHWNSSDGLAVDNIQTASIDKEGRVWCAVYNRFSVFDPIKQSFLNFKLSLSENNLFYYNYIISLQNGNILVNVKGNLVEFFPEKLAEVFPKNRLLISTVTLQNRKLLISDQEVIELAPDENFLSIRFGSLSVKEMFPFKLYYKLDGVNNDWIENAGKYEAFYTALSPGKYVFRVKAVSLDKTWESEEKRLTVIIRAPFYKTWWFVTLMFLLIVGSFGYFIVSRLKQIRNINSLKSKAQLLEKEKTTVMYENLKQHLNPHFLFNSLTSLSSLIRIDPKQAGDFLDKMSKVYRYILRNKDNETVPLIEELNFVEMYIQLQKTRFEDALHCKVDIPEALMHRRIVPVTLQNLIENAIKHNTADPDQPLVIRLFLEDDYLIVSNNLQKKNYVETSNKQGQNSMVSLYRFLSPKPVIIEETEDDYIVKIPLI